MATYAEAKQFIDATHADMTKALQCALENTDGLDFTATAMSAIIRLAADVITTMPASEDDKKHLLELTIERLIFAVAERQDEKPAPAAADASPLDVPSA